MARDVILETKPRYEAFKGEPDDAGNEWYWRCTLSGEEIERALAGYPTRDAAEEGIKRAKQAALGPEVKAAHHRVRQRRRGMLGAQQDGLWVPPSAR